MPFLFALGIALGIVASERRAAVWVLVGYFGYYAAALLMVLPESKHWAPLLLPLHVLSASGIWLALKTLHALRRPGAAAAHRGACADR